MQKSLSLCASIWILHMWKYLCVHIVYMQSQAYSATQLNNWTKELRINIIAIIS